MTFRTRKDNDQEKIEESMKLIVNLTQSYPDIDPNQWVAACYGLIVRTFLYNHLSYNVFKLEMLKAIANYEEWFQE